MHPWGLGEILVIVLIVVLFWGPKRLGNLGKGLGEGIRNFKDGMQHGSNPAAPPPPPQPSQSLQPPQSFQPPQSPQPPQPPLPPLH